MKKHRHRSPMKYWTLHRWVRKFKQKPALCVECGLVPPVDIANISGEYREDLNDFEWLCRKCHMKKDGRAKNLASMASRKGLEHSRVRLSEIQIFEIREIRKNGLSYSRIAERYGISISHACDICLGNRWKHLIGKRKPEKKADEARRKV